MDPPTFNGDAIFGDAPTMTHEDPPNAVQVNHYPGTLGIERLDLGQAEHYTIVTGELQGDTLEDLAAARDAIRTYKTNGTIATLVDTDGTEWDGSVIESFHTSQRTMAASTADGVGYVKIYQCRIVHTGIPSDGDGEPETP